MTSGSAFSVALHWVALVVGVVMLVVTTRAVMASLLVPRATRSRLVHYADRAANVTVRWFAMRRRDFAGRDHVLSYVVPVALVYLLMTFVLAYLVAFALALWAFGGSIGDALYQAGATLTTLGFVGDPSAPQVVLGLLAALVGLALVAVLIGYLLGLYGAFADRERVVAELAAVAGEPAWGPEVLCRARLLGYADTPLGYDPGALRDWMTTIRTVQTANPLLNHMRTPIPQRSWAVTLIAVTDAAVLHTTCVQGGDRDAATVRVAAEGSATLLALQAAHLFRVGRKGVAPPAFAAAAAVAEVMSDDDGCAKVMKSIALDAAPVPRAAREEAPGDPGITRAQWDDAMRLLEAAGIAVSPDRDRAWDRFGRVRAAYAGSAQAVVERVYSVPAPWTGTRTPPIDEWWPNLAAGLEKA